VRVNNLVICLVGQSVGWLLFGWLVGWLIGWLVGCLLACLFGRSVSFLCEVIDILIG